MVRGVGSLFLDGFEKNRSHLGRIDVHGTPRRKCLTTKQCDAANPHARAIREDVRRAKLLYLGTEHGVYVSFDDGANWQSLRLNLPDTPVHDLEVEERDRIFERFYRLAGHERVTGTGLGLPIARELARAMGGDLTVESRPGDGAEFTLELPRAR